MLLPQTGKHYQLCVYFELHPFKSSKEVKILNKKVEFDRSYGFMSVSGV